MSRWQAWCSLRGATCGWNSGRCAELGGQISELRLETRTETRELRYAIGRLDDRVRRVEIRLGVVEVPAHETEAAPGGDDSGAGAGGTNHDTPPATESEAGAEV